MQRKFFSKLTPYIFILPALLLVSVILLYPVVSGIISSFKNVVLTSPAPEKFIGFENYIRLFNDSMFLTAFSKSLIWTFCIVIAQLVLGYILALLLNQDIKCKKLFRSMILIPWVIPSAIVAVTWKWIYADQYGLLNGMLNSLGLFGDHAWLSDGNTAFWCLMVVAIWKGTPFVAIVILAGLQSINRNLYEAADVDGLGTIGKFWKITLPMMKKITLTVGTLTAIWTFNSFDIIQIVTRGGPGDSTLTMPMLTYKLFNQAFQVSYASALATIMMLVLVVPSYFYVRSIMKD